MNDHTAQPEHCHSCAVPLAMPGMRGPTEHHCKYCVDEHGAVLSRDTVRGHMLHWMRAWQPPCDEATLVRRVDAYMNAMPHWAE